MAKLSDRLDHVLGNKASDVLDAEFGLITVEDLLHHYPRRYSTDFSLRDEQDGERAKPGEHTTLVGFITSAELKSMRNRKGQFLSVTLGSAPHAVQATFFHPHKVKRDLQVGNRVMLSGAVGEFRGKPQLTHPDYLVLETALGESTEARGSTALRGIAGAARDASTAISAFQRNVFPIYPATKNLESWDIYRCIDQVLTQLDPVPEALPDAVLAEYGLMSLDEALRKIHMSEDASEQKQARRRLAFDEALGLQLALAMRRGSEIGSAGPPMPLAQAGLRADLLGQLPFDLTEGQRHVVAEIGEDLAGVKPMNRLLQGEVGSGKTVVALLAMMQAIDAGYQCALLAPTEVLAVQHARSLRAMLGSLATAGELGAPDDATSIALLTGSMSPAVKKQIKADVATGLAGIVIGTHALLQDSVDFHNLGLVVVDEQHRFGVEQRDRLRAKASQGIVPHLLVMTATPIPRTVALTVFGDLETSTLRELPRGRQPITTTAVFTREKPGWLARGWERIAEEVAAGRQAYVVASRIDADDKDSGPEEAEEKRPPPVPVTELYETIRGSLLPGLRIGLLHGRLPSEQKDAVMTAFNAGDIDVLVCTTVIEVGVDVPNATVMLIMDADRFGISQLHQLRGRVGRGGNKGLCLLVSPCSPAGSAGRRLRAVQDTLDGFTLAELDLEERREGDVLGRDQSGRAVNLRLLSLLDHRDMIETAREMAMRACADDPELAQQPALAGMARRFLIADQIEYLDKS
ncbi:ATP-dependent DNA helicase RecG [Mycobacteroides abscessus]|uniref:ATP-dependent DNA helicase RecG n=1 Tax=Mycobacteroides abscessus TaxID=36809 RepID=UPI000453632C|nr:ATP-dependent DNA helicase RecG [Mycobacteroides abscessus]ETZ92992.1 ATP-dependent DNA helicase RecG [Mycobacteroides abscessus MAB_030201_1061]ETZ73931.1 ATP-dependent DNA helicase RecG [Mycobacteroides abscessus MAB_110811_1470]MBE5459418.1 ATP-dependent DNA helicase RecG [Mycobacteroides abscessus]MDO3337342.1 ATP-dependent DNA helicase RecG [Mycobacteroides abscessus subsp. abscessus]QOF44135.1 ATP-dependent DNA helicase RecG [Mycobacteroides abscessus]